ncbi:MULTISPECIES: hypothetical protein [unclassified Streptomyces]|uniref:hypothetical protein n=1 Tax=unclassified Streptomyces TaxID=2593676 RepID=UPI001D053E81|nr:MULTISPECIES: hypothetical protein [unclassified Streptomyces]
MTRIKQTKTETGGDDRGLSAWAFGAILLAAFAVLTVGALVGGWAGLAVIVVALVALTVFAVTRL